MVDQRNGAVSAADEAAAPVEAAGTPPAPSKAPTGPISMRDLIDAGMHFGHRTTRWNPKMRPYIYGTRSGIHIIDLQQTLPLFRKAYRFISEVVAHGHHVLFVGTKQQAQEIVSDEAGRVGMHFVNTRWLGGTLTNFDTIKKSLDRLKEMERRLGDGSYSDLKKKEQLKIEKERQRIEKNLLGIKQMTHLPGALFVIDPDNEGNAVREARRLNVPVVALLDTNCDPDVVDYPIPGNDDAMRSIRLVTAKIAEACQEGQSRRREYASGKRDQKDDFVAAASTGQGPAVEYAARRGRSPGGRPPMRRGGGGGGRGGPGPGSSGPAGK
jgi:small subunit ribosomal protein S2